MKDYTSSNPEFKAVIKIVEVSDPGHADNINAAIKQLLHNTMKNRADIADAVIIAKGRCTGYVFDTYNDLTAWVADPKNTEILNLGDNLYIRATDVPDYWWDGNSIQQLETQKVDLSELAPLSHAAADGTYGLSNDKLYGHAMASSTTPKAAGTASAGSETAKFARGDHVHPAQTSVSGNAGTATKLKNARKINGVLFDGSTDITLETVLTQTLSAGETELTFTSAAITDDSMIDVYADTFGVYPTAIAQEGNTLTLKFDAQDSDVRVKVRVM
ncbi:MAG: hypothetical protein NC409_12375 [Clostridium sp.]|nr:hypothetical protein [Clostridium sp.]